MTPSPPFELLTVVISPAFWRSIATWKLDTVKTAPKATRTIYAYYMLGREGVTSRLRIDETGFQLSSNFYIKGRIELYDTLEAFEELNVEDIYQKECNQLVASLKEHNDSSLSGKSLIPFTLIVHCDLKKHLFRYHFLLPTLHLDDWTITSDPARYVQIDETLKVLDGRFHVADPSPPGKLSWFAQNLFSFLALCGKYDVVIGSCKQHATFVLHAISSPASPVSFRPYEPNRYSKTIDLAAMLDPMQLSREAAELNLRLMKWRIVPELDLELISNCKCLLIGAGTLGCSIARSLLGWNVRTITFVDCGTVSFSNPVRQSLFTFQDAKNKRPKAIAAAERLQEIDPNVTATGIDLKVPMPGHHETNVKMHAEHLEHLIKAHDAVFMLTDSREARWLPSVLSTLHQKIAITVALGFDSFVVQRHGTSGDNLSCFFCHDVVGPVDSMSNRSLDQQCTVTRPGLSGVASGIAVELLTSLLQRQNTTNPTVKGEDGVLGAVPHQIRGHLSTFELLAMTGHRHASCPSCGTNVQAKAKEDLVSLVQGACNRAGYLENLCGLDQVQELVVQVADDGFDVILE